MNMKLGWVAFTFGLFPLVESLSVLPEISGMAYSYSQYILVLENHNLWRRKVNFPPLPFTGYNIRNTKNLCQTCTKPDCILRL